MRWKLLHLPPQGDAGAFQPRLQAKTQHRQQEQQVSFDGLHRVDRQFQVIQAALEDLRDLESKAQPNVADVHDWRKNVRFKDGPPIQACVVKAGDGQFHLWPHN